MQPVPDGTDGELYAGGEGVALGYAGRPDLTAERFVADPFSGRSGARLYRTGDRVCRLPDGTISFRGRVDRQVKVNGKRVELDAVEAALHGTGLVSDAAVIASADRMGQRRLRAFVSPVFGKTVTAAQIRARLAVELPDYMVPGDIAVLDMLPLNVNGKIDRATLATLSSASEASAPAQVRFSSDTQVKLGTIWCRVLDRTSVGADDNFFDLGGTSLQLIEAHGLIAASFAAPVALIDLFDRPTVRSLAEFIDRAGRADQAGGAADRIDTRMAARRAAMARAARGSRSGAAQ